MDQWLPPGHELGQAEYKGGNHPYKLVHLWPTCQKYVLHIMYNS